MIELAVASAALAAAAGIFAGLFPPRGTIAFCVALGLLFEGLIVATVLIAGLVLQALRPEILFGVALAWLALALVLAWRSPTRRAGWRQRARRAAQSLTVIVREPAVALAALLMLGTLAWRVFLALRLPVGDYDGFSYHLVFGDVWIQAGAITNVPQRIWTAGFPANGEVVITWLMAFTHSDQFASLSSVIPIPLGMAATAGLARRFGAAARPALLAGLLFGMTPALDALAGTAYVDATSVAFAVATWYLGLRLLRDPAPRTTALLLGLAGGLAIGTKGTNAPLTAVILVAAGLLLVWRLVRPAVRSHRDVLITLTALVLPVVAFGTVWYVKNLVVYGNPLYPFAVGPFAGPTTLASFAIDVPQLSGMPRIEQLAVSWTWDWGLTRYQYNLRPGGLGRAWPLIVLFAGFGLAWLVRARRWAALALVVIPAGLTLATMPMPWYARETLFVVALGLALAAVFLTALRPRLATLGGLAIVALAAISLVFANAKPNAAFRSDKGHLTTSGRQFLELVLTGSEARRSSWGLRGECAGFSVIPVGDRVAPAGFNLLHGVVGPNLDRILTAPLAVTTDPATLVAEARAVGATWIVTNHLPVTDDSGVLDGVAQSAPALFTPYGTICRGGRLWQVNAGG